MYYAVTHLTNYDYSKPITDSVMEARLQPLSADAQRCVRFKLDVSPEAKVLSHRDYLGNMIHTFNIPAAHTQLALKAEAVVEVKRPATLPGALPESAWERLDAMQEDRDVYDMLLDGQYTRTTDLLRAFADDIGWGERYADPLTLLRDLNRTMYEQFDYAQQVTRVDSPIDVALSERSGVCQDFTHIMLTLVRSVGIPARYVSGYLYHREDTTDRSVADASHAWLEALLPGLGWVGFDPTNNLIVADRHIRVCLAQDYASASPTRGVFKGDADTTLSVQVRVSHLEQLPLEDTKLAPEITLPRYSYHQVQQQQQQQQ